MAAGRTDIFVDPDDYRSGFSSVGIELVVVCAGKFKARLTRVELCQLSLQRGQENLARVAYLKLASERAFLTFPTDGDSSMIWAGVQLRPGDIVFHSLGDQMYQRTIGPCRWGSISLTPDSLLANGRALADRDLVPPPIGRVVRPSLRAGGRLRSLHRSACRLAETKPEVVAHPEVSRAIDQDLIHSLVTCLASGDVLVETPLQRRHAGIMTRFEELLAGHPALPIPIPKLCKVLEVSERSLRTWCDAFLGMSPNRYLHLQRIHATHCALRHADPATCTVAEVARRNGFSQLGRFAADYRAVFDKLPSATLRRQMDPVASIGRK